MAEGSTSGALPILLGGAALVGLYLYTRKAATPPTSVKDQINGKIGDAINTSLNLGGQTLNVVTMPVRTALSIAVTGTRAAGRTIAAVNPVAALSQSQTSDAALATMAAGGNKAAEFQQAFRAGVW